MDSTEAKFDYDFLMSAFGQIQDPRFVIVTVQEKTDVYPALQKWFCREG